MSEELSLAELQAALDKALADAKAWKDAWYRQREATGIGYWDGYRNGQNAPNKD